MVESKGRLLGEWGVEALYPYVYREKTTKLEDGVVRLGWDESRGTFAAQVWILEEGTGEMFLWAERGSGAGELATVGRLESALKRFGELSAGLLERLREDQRSAMPNGEEVKRNAVA